MAAKMYKCVKLLVLFCGIGLSSATDPRAINLAIESSFYLDPKDVEDNSALLDKVKTFIDKLQDAISPHHVNFRRSQQRGVFTDFLTELGVLVMNYDDDMFSTLALDLKEVVDEKSETPDFNFVFKDKNFAQFIKETINEWSKTTPTKLKLEIAKYVTNSQTTAFVTFFRNLNKYFTEADQSKLTEIVKEFEKVKQGQGFKDVLNKAIQFTIFDRFKKAKKEFIKSFDNDVMKINEYIMKKENELVLKLKLAKSFNATKDNVQSDMSEEVHDFRGKNNIQWN